MQRREDTPDGYPIGEYCRRTAVLGLLTRDPGPEANLVGPLELNLFSSPPNTRRGSVLPYMRRKNLAAPGGASKLAAT